MSDMGSGTCPSDRRRGTWTLSGPGRRVMSGWVDGMSGTLDTGSCLGIDERRVEGRPSAVFVLYVRDSDPGSVDARM